MGAWPLTHPGQFLLQKHLALVLNGGVGFLALGFGQQIIGVIAGVREEAPVGQLHHARRHAVQEVAIVRRDDVGAVEAVEKLGDPLDGFRVEMVRRFVENQEIRQRHQRAAHRHATLLAAGKRLNAPVASRAIQVRDGHGDALVQRPAFQRGDAMFQLLVALGFRRQRLKLRDQIQHRLGAIADVFVHRLGGVQHEVLRQVAHDEFAPPRDVAGVRRLQLGQDAQERRLAAAVAPDQADAVAFDQAKRGGVEHGAVAVADGDFSGGEDGRHEGKVRSAKVEVRS